MGQRVSYLPCMWLTKFSTLTLDMASQEPPRVTPERRKWRRKRQKRQRRRRRCKKRKRGGDEADKGEIPAS